MKCIVTGATSFIGLNLTQHLLNNGNEVYAVCRKNSVAQFNVPVGAIIIDADMSEYGMLCRKIREADIFINLAWEGTGHGGRDMKDVQLDNIRHTLQAIHSAKAMGCQVFVEAGSQAEYGTVMEIITEETPCYPFSEYGKAKLEVKERAFPLCAELGMKYIHLRIFSVFGENDHPWTLVMSALDKMLRNEVIDLSPCTQNWNFIYVKDAVHQIARLCEYATSSKEFRQEVFNIASSDTRVLKEFVEEMKLLTHSVSKLNFGAMIPNHVVSLQPDVTKLIKTTKLMTFTPFEEGIKAILYVKNIDSEYS